MNQVIYQVIHDPAFRFHAAHNIEKFPSIVTHNKLILLKAQRPTIDLPRALTTLRRPGADLGRVADALLAQRVPLRYF